MYLWKKLFAQIVDHEYFNEKNVQYICKFRQNSSRIFLNLKP